MLSAALAESNCYHYFPFSEFSYKLIRFSFIALHIIKSDNEIGPLYCYCLKGRYVEGQNFPCAAMLKVRWKAIRKPNLHFTFTFLEWIVPV